MTSREEFLIAMYSEAWRNIDRHILVVWQSAGVLGATLTVLFAVEKSAFSVDLAFAFELVVVAWLYAHILDAEYWFRRNILIIANIERQFLTQLDVAEIHHYFAPRTTIRPVRLEHLRAQRLFATGLVAALFVWHATETTWNGMASLPYVLVLILGVWLLNFRDELKDKIATLETRSPGRQVLQDSSRLPKA